MNIIILICLTLYVMFIIFIISGLFRHRTLPIISLSKGMPNVSVVIAARNEEDNIQNIIDDLISQEYPLDKLEVIIVNDRSTDSTENLLKQAEDNYAFIKIITVTEKSKNMAPKKNALTVGIQNSNGEIIVLTDADCRVGKLWVSSMVYSVVNRDSIIIGFSKIKDNGGIFEQYQQLDFLSIISANAGAAGWGYFWSGTGQNIAFFKNDFYSINGFDPVKEKISGDDMYLVQAITKLRNGYTHIDPNSFVTTIPMQTIKSFINQRIRWSSNSKMNLTSSPLFFGFLATMFLYNIVLFLYLLKGENWFFLFSVKFIFDGIVISLGAQLFNTKINIKSYCIWAVLQPLYIPMIGLLGLRGKYSWKS